MDYAVYFEDGTCPKCGIGKILRKEQQNNTFTYECDTCGTEFHCQWKPDGNEYVPQPLYKESMITNLLNQFSKEDKENVNKNDNDRNLKQNQPYKEQAGQPDQ